MHGSVVHLLVHMQFVPYLFILYDMIPLLGYIAAGLAPLDRATVDLGIFCTQAAIDELVVCCFCMV